MKAFLPLALCFLLTILPFLFLIRSLLAKPPTVVAFVPLNTTNFLPTLLTRFFFMAFMALGAAAFMARFMAFFFMTFMALAGAAAFIAFIALAMVILRSRLETQ